MKVVVVAPGHAFSTIDVWRGLCAGLRAQGADVLEFPLHTTIETFEVLLGAAEMTGARPGLDARILASSGIPGFVMAKQPDWVVFVHGLNVPPSIPVTLRRGGYRTALLLTETPYQLDEEAPIAPCYDVVLTNERRGPALLPGAHYLPHAYHPALHTPEGPHADPADVFFCGTRYPERDALLSGVDWTGIAVCDRTITAGMSPEDALSRILSNEDVAMHYRSARISLNHHRQTRRPGEAGAIPWGMAESLNPRAYEIPACGGFMVSDIREELADVFGDCVPVYQDAEGLERIIRYYLTHEDERRALAARQRAAVQPHSWTARAGVLLDILTTHTAARKAA